MTWESSTASRLSYLRVIKLSHSFFCLPRHHHISDQFHSQSLLRVSPTACWTHDPTLHSFCLTCPHAFGSSLTVFFTSPPLAWPMELPSYIPLPSTHNRYHVHTSHHQPIALCIVPAECCTSRLQVSRVSIQTKPKVEPTTAVIPRKLMGWRRQSPGAYLTDPPGR